MSSERGPTGNAPSRARVLYSELSRSRLCEKFHKVSRDVERYADAASVLTEYEKEHIAERQPLPERYLGLSDEEMDARIAAAKAALGRRLVILGHHYQRDEVIKFADYTGDSFKLARQVSQHPDAEFIVFCGVHFMAESADVLSADHQQVILPDLAAGCSMADMADPDQLEMCWSDLEQMLGSAQRRRPGHLHQLRRVDQSVLRRARRRRLHVVERRGDAEVGVGARRADPVPARSASRPQHRLQAGRAARPDGRVGSERDLGRRSSRTRSSARA